MPCKDSGHLLRNPTITRRASLHVFHHFLRSMPFAPVYQPKSGGDEQRLLPAMMEWQHG